MPVFRMASDEAYVYEFERRRGVWRPKIPLRQRLWTWAVEWGPTAAVVCGVLGVGGMAGLYAARPDLDAQSHRFADETVRSVAPGWNRLALLSRAAPDFIDGAPDVDQGYFQQLKAVGPASDIQSCIGGASVDPKAWSGVITAQYTCRVQVRRQSSLVALSLKKQAGDWKVTGFYLSRPQALNR